MVSIKLKRKGQVFTFDYIAGFIMFVIIAIIAGKQLVNIIPSDSYNQLYEENIYFSTTLLQSGYPEDWDTSNVLIPGLTTDNRLDTSKLANYDSLTYDEGKSYFHIINNFIFHFKFNDSIIYIDGECSFGFPLPTNTTTCEPQFDTIAYTNLVKSTRLLIYNGTIIEMELFSWN